MKHIVRGYLALVTLLCLGVIGWISFYGWQNEWLRQRLLPGMIISLGATVVVTLVCIRSLGGFRVRTAIIPLVVMICLLPFCSYYWYDHLVTAAGMMAWGATFSIYALCSREEVEKFANNLGWRVGSALVVLLVEGLLLWCVLSGFMKWYLAYYHSLEAAWQEFLKMHQWYLWFLAAGMLVFVHVVGLLCSRTRVEYRKRWIW